MNIAVTIDVNDDALADLPSGDVPVVEPLEVNQRDNVFDIVVMEAKFDEYKSNSESLKSLHKGWNDAYNVWGKRLDLVYGKVSAIDGSAAVILGNEPGSDFEAFEIFSLGNLATSVGAIIGFGSSVYTAYKAKQAYDAASATFHAAAGAAGAAQAEALTAMRWAKFQAGVAAVGMILSGYIAYRTVADRTEFLISSLPSLEEWFADGKEQIEFMQGQVTEVFLVEIREIARILGVGVPNDDNQTYHNVIEALNTAMTDAAEVEAQYKVATRMLCPIPGRTPESYAVGATATATGLPQTVVQTRANEIAADEENICAPYRPST